MINFVLLKLVILAKLVVSGRRKERALWQSINRASQSFPSDSFVIQLSGTLMFLSIAYSYAKC